jgi:hypothetical protein
MPETKLTRKLECVLVPSCGLFLNRADDLLDWDGIVIIFDVPVRCDGLIGLTMLDVKERDQSFRYTFEKLAPEALLQAVKAAHKAAEDVYFHVRTSNLIPYLLSQTSASQMDRIQTWKYSIKNTELRDAAMAKLTTWFFAPKPSVDQLRSALAKLLNVQSDRLDILFRDNRFAELKKAVLQVSERRQAGKPVPVDKVAEEHGVSAFDIRYLQNAYSKLGEGDLDPPVELAEVQRAARRKLPCPLKGESEAEADGSEDNG